MLWLSTDLGFVATSARTAAPGFECFAMSGAHAPILLVVNEATIEAVVDNDARLAWVDHVCLQAASLWREAVNNRPGLRGRIGVVRE